MPDLTIATQTIAAGTRGLVRIPVTRDRGVNIEIVAHGVAGRHDGPTVLLLSMLHGNEWFSVLILRELLRRTDPSGLRGCIVAVPVANAAATFTSSRCLQDDSDEPDTNRAFGGTYQWLSNQVANAIADRLFAGANFLIDYHVSDWGSTMADVSYVGDYRDPRLSEASRGMALAYGFPVLHAQRIHSGLRGPRTSIGHAGERYGIAGIVPGIGGLGFGEAQETDWLERNVRGTIGTLQYLDMLDGDPAYCDRYLEIEDYWRVSPRQGGYLECLVGLDRQLREVGPGDLLARLIDPTTFEVAEELRAPGNGILFYTCRSYMIRPGSWAFGVAKTGAGGSRWIDGPVRPGTAGG